MKSILLSLALIPLLLTGCASSGYVSDYPGYYGPGYYDPAYYGGPVVGVSYYNSGYYSHNNYHNNYHHYATNYNHAYASNGNHGNFHQHANVASAGGFRAGGANHASAATRSAHMGGGHLH